MTCPRFPHTRHPYRHSLRRRLAASFVLIAMISLMAAFMVITHGRTTGNGRHPWSFNVIFPALFVAGAAGAFTAGRITGRLSRLRDAAERLDLRDLSVRVPVEGDDEVASLARAFNRMADRLEAEEKVRRQFFADVAHELRHPLSVQQNRLEMIQDGLLPLNPEQVLLLQDNVLALTKLVGDVRDLSLAEVGQLSLSLAPLDLGELIADLAENMEPVAAAKQIRLVAEVAADLPEIEADVHRIRQVLVNLLANAVHYTPEGGVVTVKAGRDREQVVIEIADTGPGIARADLPHVFDRFYRADKARARSTGGSGLGLAIVRSLVDLHGGTVSADSAPGKGSRFTVRLPLHRSSTS